MSNTVRHKRLPTAPAPSDPDLLGAPDWLAEHNFAGGIDGSILLRDSTQTDGVSWLNSADGPKTLVARGTGLPPEWSTQLDIPGISVSFISGAQTNFQLMSCDTLTAGVMVFVGTDPDLGVPVVKFGPQFQGAPDPFIMFTNTQEFADNAAAIAGGLPVGAVYRTGDILKIVH